MDGQVELRLDPRSGRFDSHDHRWLDQVSDLVGELVSEVGGVRRQWALQPGAKGGLDAIVVSVVSAGGLTAAIELVKSWLTRDRTRSLKVSFSDGGAVESIEVSGSKLDDHVFDDLLRVALRRLPGD